MENTYYDTVCVIEDNPIDVLLIEQAITHSNFASEILVFETPDTALAWFKSLDPKKDMVPEIIFLDLNMPKYNGFELIDKMKSEVNPDIFKKCQFFILTSSSDPNDIIKSNTYKNILTYITKPIEYTDLHPNKFMSHKEKYFRQKSMMWG